MARPARLGLGRPVGPAEYNALVDGAIQHSTGAGDPAAPRRGDIRMRDESPLTAGSMGVEVYYGATTGWQLPWNMPWGRVASAVVSSDSSTYTGTLVDLNVSATFTTIGGRRYRVEVGGAHVTSTVGSATGAERSELRITNAANTLLDGGQVRVAVLNAGILEPVGAMVGIDNGAPAAGSVTYKVRGIRDLGSGNHTLKAGSIAVCITVEDIGPNGAPPAA